MLFLLSKRDKAAEHQKALSTLTYLHCSLWPASNYDNIFQVCLQNGLESIKTLKDECLKTFHTEVELLKVTNQKRETYYHIVQIALMTNQFVDKRVDVLMLLGQHARQTIKV